MRDRSDEGTVVTMVGVWQEYRRSMVGVWQQYGSSIAALGLGWWDALLISHEGIADALHKWRWEDWQMMSNGLFCY